MYGFVMPFENTITECDLDASTRQYVQAMPSNDSDYDPDLAVDGLSDSVISRLLKLFGFGRNRH